MDVPLACERNERASINVDLHYYSGMSKVRIFWIIFSHDL